MRRTKLLFVCLLCCFVVSGVSFLGQTDSGNLNKPGRGQNPPGVDVTLRTTNGKSTFHLFETIPIELVFQASRPSTYSIELDEVMNFAGQANQFAVFPADSVFETAQHFGVVCCETDRRFLSSQPTILKRELTDYLRFEKPGTYSICYATRRVFRGRGKANDFNESSLTLTSNILTLTILPDDPDWDSTQLADTLKKLRDTEVDSEYVRALTHAKTQQSETARDYYIQNRISQTELVKAQKALNAIDTEEAIHERIKLMNMNTKEDLEFMRKFGGWASEPEPLLHSTSRPDVVARCMKERADEPEFGVDYNFVSWWSIFLLQRGHPELVRPSSTLSFSTPLVNAPQDGLARVTILHGIVNDLQAALVNKKGKAAELTTFTLKFVKSLPGMQEGIKQ